MNQTYQINLNCLNTFVLIIYGLFKSHEFIRNYGIGYIIINIILYNLLHAIMLNIVYINNWIYLEYYININWYILVIVIKIYLNSITFVLQIDIIWIKLYTHDMMKYINCYE